MPVIGTLLTQLRTLARDLPTSNRSVGETPKGVADGSNTKFSLQNPILFSVSTTPQIWWSTNGTYRSQTGITIVDAAMGIITISPAPAAGTQNAPFRVDYYFYWFLDADHTEFLNDASRDLIGSGDPTKVIDGLISALLQYALGHFYQARATQYANRYSSSGGSAGQSVDKITDAFQKLAESAFKKAKEMRDDYYKDLGQRESAASTIISYPIPPVTPPR